MKVLPSLFVLLFFAASAFAQSAETRNNADSTHSKKKPLFIVDDIIRDSIFVRKEIQPSDIERIDVIKGVEAVKIYGPAAKE